MRGVLTLHRCWSRQMSRFSRTKQALIRPVVRCRKQGGNKMSEWNGWRVVVLFVLLAGGAAMAHPQMAPSKTINEALTFKRRRSTALQGHPLAGWLSSGAG